MLRDSVADSIDSIQNTAYRYMRVAIVQYSNRPILAKSLLDEVDHTYLNATIRLYEQV